MYCIVLYCLILSCIVLYCLVLSCIVLYGLVLSYIVSYCRLLSFSGGVARLGGKRRREHVERRVRLQQHETFAGVHRVLHREGEDVQPHPGDERLRRRVGLAMSGQWAVMYACVRNHSSSHKDEHVSRRGGRPLRVGTLYLPTLPLARLGLRRV